MIFSFRSIRVAEKKEKRIFVVVNLAVMSRQVSPNRVIIQKYSKSEGGLQVTFPRKDIDQLGHSVSRYAD